ncbi:AAA family ATPase [Chromobacterium piscinae]|uniref:AAA family ATPase n=1 Tax=Chromobacterium piscinae TaxID=686831 RepID=A0ABV0HB24_9NEIS|nr:AAA family ATPase [Chromobacterium piscinae]MBX9348655.1 AAA family ATPase [Chromobacterium vaccinii]MCD5330081.1 AAA family ATPase [Chromobacterium piscinae]NHQ83347.1 AAA domain-containing protein [Chromobacterium vaccinii]
MTSPSQQAAQQVRAGIRTATRGLVGRDQLAELIMLAAVAQEHLLVIGPPGTAKSAVVRRVAQTMGGRYFEYLLGRFTEPSELFGPVDLRKLREGSVETDTAGMLPEAEVAFLDEVFLGSTAILNTLLGILNERRFRRGHTQLHCPLRVCIGAANSLPDDASLAAFGDRFLLHAFVEPAADHQLEAMLEGGWQADQPAAATEISLADIDLLCAAAREADMSAVRPILAQAIRQLRGAGINLSDRRIVKSQRLIAAAAVLAGRMSADASDLWPLLYALPTQEAQQQAREVLREQLAACANGVLASAVETAAVQPLSRVSRLMENAQSALNAETDRSAIEALLREIDANFSADGMPDELAASREKLTARLAEPA